MLSYLRLILLQERLKCISGKYKLSVFSLYYTRHKKVRFLYQIFENLLLCNFIEILMEEIC